MDHQNPDSLVRIPARYALNALLREISSIWNEDQANYWTHAIVEMVKSGRVTIAGIEGAIDRVDPRIVVSMTRRDGRRLGKPQPVFDMVRMQLSNVVPRDALPGANLRQILMLRRDVIAPRGKEVDIRSGGLGVAIDRHAIERLYERENCTPGELLDRLRSDLSRLAGDVAYARAAGLIKRRKGSGDDRTDIRPGEMALVPMGAGVLVMEALQLDVTGITARRVLVRQPESRITAAQHDQETTVPARPMDGKPAIGLIVMTGITYLADDMLRMGQRDYLALYEDMTEHVDRDALGNSLGRVFLPHERRPPAPSMPPQNDRMMRLLRENVNRNKKPVAWRTQSQTTGRQ